MNHLARRRTSSLAHRLSQLEYLEDRLLLAFTNGGFESGLTGYEQGGTGSGYVVTKGSFQGRSAAQGSNFALLSTGMDTGTTTLSQTFHATAGDSLTGQAFFYASAKLVTSDNAKVVLLDSSGNTIATLFSSAAPFNQATFTPWTSFNYTIANPGDYKLVATVVNGEECSDAAYLGLDAINLQSTSNPTPGTITTSPDTYTLDQGATLTIAAPGVLGNDAASDSSSLSAAVAAGPSHGTLNLNANGSFTYTPTAGYSGSDQFTYTASGTNLTSATGTVTLTIKPSTPTPGTINVGADTYTTPQDTPLTVNAPGVLQNDTASNSSALSATLLTGTTHGTITVNANGSFTYVPNSGFSGTDTFTYQAAGSGLTSATGTATISVTPSNVVTEPGNGITYDLRFANGSKVATVTAPGTYSVDLWALVHDPNPPFTDDGLSFGLVNVVSQQINGGAIGSGGVTSGQTTAAFTRPGESHNGVQNNITNDGISDWGTTQSTTPISLPSDAMRFISANTTSQGYKAQLAGTPVAGESEQLDAHTWEWRVARFTITVTSVGTTGGETDFLAQFPNSDNGDFLLAGFFQDQPGLTQSGQSATISNSPRNIGAPLRFVFGTTPIT